MQQNALFSNSESNFFSRHLLPVLVKPLMYGAVSQDTETSN
jgi:hypothetical protein